MFFNKERNKAWYQNNDGTISTKVLANQSIAPNETKNITLVLTKKMTGENIGIIINKAKCENSESQAELIISIKTGRIIIYISLVISITAIIAIGIYFIKKRVI